LIVWFFNEKARFFNNFSKEKKNKKEKILINLEYSKYFSKTKGILFEYAPLVC